MSHFSVSTGHIGNHVSILPLKGVIKLASLIVYLRPNEARRIFLFCPLTRFPFAFPWPCLTNVAFFYPFLWSPDPPAGLSLCFQLGIPLKKVIKPVAQPQTYLFPTLFSGVHSRGVLQRCSLFRPSWRSLYQEGLFSVLSGLIYERGSGLFILQHTFIFFSPFRLVF